MIFCLYQLIRLKYSITQIERKIHYTQGDSYIRKEGREREKQILKIEEDSPFRGRITKTDGEKDT